MPYFSKISVLLLLVLTATSSFADPTLHAKQGSSSWAFLKIDLSPRTTALGGAGLSDPSYAGEARSNPLALSRVGHAALAADYTLLPEVTGAKMQGLYFALPGESWNLGWGGRFLRYDDIQGRDEFGAPTGEYGSQAYGLSFALSPAGQNTASHRLHWAVQGHIANYSIEKESSQAAFMDAGLRGGVNENWLFAVMVSNLGYASSFVEQRVILPLTLEAASTHILDFSEDYQFKSHVSFKRANDEDMRIITAAELVYLQIFTLRVGYPWHFADAALSGGAGIKLGGWSLDYAYRAHKSLHGAHHVGLEIAF